MAIGIRRKTPKIIERGAPLVASFTENLKPGLTYQVVNLQITNLSEQSTLSYKWHPELPGRREDCFRQRRVVAGHGQRDHATAACPLARAPDARGR